MFSCFTPKIGEMIQFDEHIFFKWVVQPPNWIFTLQRLLKIQQAYFIVTCFGQGGIGKKS